MSKSSIEFERKKIKRNDLQPYWKGEAINDDGTVIDLTGALITCTMRLQGSSVLKINQVAAVITNATLGLYEYRWVSGDTNTIGIYDIEFQVTPGAGGKFTLPSPKYGQPTVEIVEDLDAT